MFHAYILGHGIEWNRNTDPGLCRNQCNVDMRWTLYCLVARIPDWNYSGTDASVKIRLLNVKPESNTFGGGQFQDNEIRKTTYCETNALYREGSGENK